MQITLINDVHSYFTADKENNRIILNKAVNTKKGIIYKQTVVSTYIDISQKIISEDYQYVTLEFNTGHNDIYASKTVKKEILFDDGYKLSQDFTEIVNRGFSIFSGGKKYLLEYLQSLYETVEPIKGTNLLGWHNVDTDEPYFLSSGLSTIDDVIFTGKSGFQFVQKGDLTDYYDRIAQIFYDNPLIFAICSYCSSAFILPFINEEINQVLALNGTTSKGKSSVGKLALSMFTHPKSFKGLNGTKGSLEYILKQNNHHFMFFDEVQESTMKQEDKMSFMFGLANGTDRTRLTKSITDYQLNSDNLIKYKYTVLFAGEKSFLNGVKTEDTGLSARFLEILLPPEMALWESITDPTELENLIGKFLEENHGHVGPDLIELIRDEHKQIIEKYEQKKIEVRAKYGDDNTLIKRKIRILAYTYVMSELLARIIYHDKSQSYIKTVVDNAFESFNKALFSNMSTERVDLMKEKLSHMDDRLARYLVNEDDLLSQQPNNIISRWGYIKYGVSYKEVSIIYTQIDEVCSALDVDKTQFISYLKTNNLLKHDKDSNTKKVSINGNRARYYVIHMPRSFFEETKIDNDFDIDTDDSELPAEWGKASHSVN